MRTRQRTSGSDKKVIKASKHYSNIMESQHEEDIDIHKPEKNPPAYGAVLPQTFVDNYRFYKEEYERAKSRLLDFEQLCEDIAIRDEIILSLKTELANKQDSFDKQNQNHVTEILLMKTDMVSILQRLRDSVERGCLYIKKHNIDFNELLEEVSSL